MSAPEKFRSALNGFNRDDVVNYLEYLNNKHNLLVNRLNAEVESLRAQLQSPDQSPSEELSVLEQERDALALQLEELRTQKDALQERCDALERALADAQTVSAPAEIPPAVPTEAVCSPEAELEMYRRAERTERIARERAEQLYRQTNGVLTEASLRVNEMADRVVPMADQILMQLSQLQSAVYASRQSLQDAVGILNTLHPDHN